MKIFKIAIIPGYTTSFILFLTIKTRDSVRFIVNPLNSDCIVFIDALNADLDVREIKKETNESVSSIVQRLDEKTRSRARQLKDTILAELVNINDDAKMSYGDYIRAINESDRWNTIILTLRFSDNQKPSILKVGKPEWR